MRAMDVSWRWLHMSDPAVKKGDINEILKQFVAKHSKQQE